MRRIQVLVQLNQAESVIYPFVHEGQLHVATQLFVGQLQKILGNKDDCGYCKDTPTPTAVGTTQLLKILPHQKPHNFVHRTRVQFEVLEQHTPPMQTSFSRLQFTWCCRCEMCKCCVLYCSQRRNVYTLREAEHVQAHTVEITFARLEHHIRNGSQDDFIVNSLVLSTDDLPIANVLFTATNVRFKVSPFSSRLPRGPLRKTLPRQKYHTLSPRHAHQQHWAPIRGQSLS